MRDTRPLIWGFQKIIDHYKLNDDTYSCSIQRFQVWGDKNLTMSERFGADVPKFSDHKIKLHNVGSDFKYLYLLSTYSIQIVTILISN